MPDEGPYELTVGAGDAIGWTPYSDAPGTEMPGVPNASFGAGSVKIEATRRIVGCVMAVDATGGERRSMGAQPLVEKSRLQSE